MKDLRAAFLAALDNHLCLACYPYFSKPDDFMLWDKATLGRFIYIVKEYLRSDNLYFKQPGNLPDRWIPEHEILWMNVLLAHEAK